MKSALQSCSVCTLVWLFALRPAAHSSEIVLDCGTLFAGSCTEHQRQRHHQVCVQKEVQALRGKVQELHRQCSGPAHQTPHGASHSRGQCNASLARLPDGILGMEDWTELQAVCSHINTLHPVKHPVVLVSVLSIPCHSGCCPVDIFVRPRTTDTEVLTSLYGHQAFSHLYALGWTPQTILDAGANIGLASVLFSHLWPNARIVSVEPDPGNFKLLELNTARFGNVHIERRGLWSHETSLQLMDSALLGLERSGEWGIMVVEATSPNAKAEVSATTVPALLSRHGLAGFDFCKIDIEGAEKPVFEAALNETWVQQGRLFAVESHEDMVPGAWAAIETAMQRHGATYVSTWPEDTEHSYFKREPSAVAKAGSTDRVSTQIVLDRTGL